MQNTQFPFTQQKDTRSASTINRKKMVDYVLHLTINNKWKQAFNTLCTRVINLTQSAYTNSTFFCHQQDGCWELEDWSVCCLKNWVGCGTVCYFIEYCRLIMFITLQNHIAENRDFQCPHSNLHSSCNWLSPHTKVCTCSAQHHCLSIAHFPSSIGCSLTHCCRLNVSHEFWADL